MEKIPDTPPIPPELLRAISSERAVFFLGAGVSQIIGCKNWKSLAINIVKACYEKGFISYKEEESLENIRDPKKLITICYDILCSKGNKDIFFDVIKKSFDPNLELLHKYDIYKILSGISVIYVTTNIDVNFDKYFPERIIYKKEDIVFPNLERDKLYKIHGTIEDQESIIFTTRQYLTQYQTDEYSSFLRRLFAENSVVFIGYGLDEFEILDFLVTRTDKQRDLKHYIILPYYKEEEYLFDYDISYFKTLGINVIAYAKNLKGYTQLFNVLSRWKEEIIESTNLLQKDVDEMEMVVKTYGK